MQVYTGPGWEVREGRWEDSPLEECDHVISDPPYDAATHKGHGCETRNRAPVEFDPVVPADIAAPLVAIAQCWTILFCSDLQGSEYGHAVGGRRTTGGNFVRLGLWLKIGPMPQFSGDRPASWGECIAIMHAPGKMRWNGGGRPAVWRFGSDHTDRFHQTPKPLDLMLALVSDFTDPGDLVWDPFCGSGTTGVACLRLGRRFVGHEMQPHYAKVASERLEAEGRCLTLADVRRGQTSILDRLTDNTGGHDG